MTRLDRVARSVGDFQRMIEQITQWRLIPLLTACGIDTAFSTGKLMLTILETVAAFEIDIRRERQRDGIEKATERSVYQGRPPTIDPLVIKKMRDSGAGLSAIAASLGVSGPASIG